MESVAKDEVIETVTDNAEVPVSQMWVVQAIEEATAALRAQIRAALKQEAQRLSDCGSKRNARVIRNTIDRIGL